MKKRPPNLVGIELEFASPVSARTIVDRLKKAGIPAKASTEDTPTSSMWKVVPDGSLCYSADEEETRLRGLELVSPPLAMNNLSILRPICKILRELGCKTTIRCGMHVHVGCGDLATIDKCAVVRKYRFFEPYINKMVKHNRRRGHYYCASSSENMSKLFRLAMFGSHEKYSKVSLNNAFLRSGGTIEFRQHHGTLDFEEIYHWTHFCYGLTRSCKNYIDDKINLPEMKLNKKELRLLTQMAEDGLVIHGLYPDENSKRIETFLKKITDAGVEVHYMRDMFRLFTFNRPKMLSKAVTLKETISEPEYEKESLWQSVPKRTVDYLKNVATVSGFIESAGDFW
jgi:hypothetical protein